MCGGKRTLKTEWVVAVGRDRRSQEGTAREERREEWAQTRLDTCCPSTLLPKVSCSGALESPLGPARF